MAIVAIVNAATSSVIDVNQYKNWLVDGTITDTPLLLIYNGASSLATFTQNGAGDGLTITGVSSGSFSIKDGTAGKWQVGTGGITVLGGGAVISAGGVKITAGNLGIGTAAAAQYGIIVNGNVLSGSVTQNGIVSQATYGSGATTSGTGVYSQIITTAAAFTMINGYNFYVADASLGAGSAITNLYGLYISALTFGGTNYAIYTNAGINSIGDQFTVRAGPIIGNMSTDTFSGAVTITVDRTKGNMHKVAATSNTASTFTPSAAGTAGQHMTILITADGTGGNVITFASTFKPNGTLTTTANKGHTISFWSDGTNWWEYSRTLAL
jgi:hypothetical protein